MKMKFLLMLSIVLSTISGLSYGQIYHFGAGVGAEVDGLWTGSSTLGDILKKGKYGTGTAPDGLGEITLIGGTFYNRDPKTDAVFAYKNDQSKPPYFMNFNFSNRKQSCEIGPFTSKDEFEKQFIAECAKGASNYFYGIYVEKASLDKVKLRSSSDYKDPSKTVHTVFNDVSGEIVGIYGPTYLGSVFLAGDHIHFVSKDKKEMGHIVDIRTTQKLKITFEQFPTLEWVFPKNQEFVTKPLTPKDAGIFLKHELEQRFKPGE